MANRPVACPHAGRRLPEAEEKLRQFGAACRARASAPDQVDACRGAALGEQLEEDRAWAFRCLGAIAAKKFQYLGKLPYSLAAASTSSMNMRRCLEEYDATPMNRRHRVASEFFDGEMRRACEALIQTGVLADGLARLLQGIQLVPLTEDMVEAPHAQMQKERERQRASSRSWQSCTNLLSTTIELYNTFDQAMLYIF